MEITSWNPSDYNRINICHKANTYIPTTGLILPKEEIIIINIFISEKNLIYKSKDDLEKNLA